MDHGAERNKPLTRLTSNHMGEHTIAFMKAGKPETGHQIFFYKSGLLLVG